MYVKLSYFRKNYDICLILFLFPVDIYKTPFSQFIHSVGKQETIFNKKKKKNGIHVL